MFTKQLAVLLFWVAAASALPRVRRSSGFALPGGLPLDLFFSSCETAEGDDDIGPCLAELLGGAIDVARPNFTTGVVIRDDVIVLEPLDLDDVKPKKDKDFQLGVTNLKLYGISNINIEAINFRPETVALDLSFNELSASGHMALKYIFITAAFDVVLELQNLRVRLDADWRFQHDDGDLNMVLSNAKVNLEVGDLNLKIDGLASAGRFVERIVNRNSKILVDFLVPTLEKSVNKKVNEKLNRIKVAS